MAKSITRASLLVIAGLVAAPPAMAANNPLNTIIGVNADEKSKGIKVEESSEGKPSLASIHDGDYAVYKSLDFDSGVAAFQMHCASPNKGTVEVHLDSATVRSRA